MFIKTGFVDMSLKKRDLYVPQRGFAIIIHTGRLICLSKRDDYPKLHRKGVDIATQKRETQ